MFGAISSLNYDADPNDRGPAPEPGDELLVWSVSLRSFRAYVVRSSRRVNSEVNPARWNLRLMRIPVDQLHEGYQDVYRYTAKSRQRTRLQQAWRRAGRPGEFDAWVSDQHNQASGN